VLILETDRKENLWQNVLTVFSRIAMNIYCAYPYNYNEKQQCQI